MITKSTGLEYFDELLEVHLEETIPIDLKYVKLRSMLERVAKELTSAEIVQFSNLFSRLSYICEKFKVSKRIHSFRITANKILHEGLTPTDEEYYTHLKYLSEFISNTFIIAVPEKLKALYPKAEFRKSKKEVIVTNIHHLRVEVVEIQRDFLICASDEDESGEFIKVRINETEVNVQFKSVNSFWKGAQLHLVNILIDTADVYHPKFIILEPDYLIDISAIAECFQDHGISELNFIRSKFEEVPNSKYIRLGNFANLVVDELFGNSNPHTSTFANCFEKDFKSYPFEYTACDDLAQRDDFMQYWNDCQLHYDRIKQVVTNEFDTQGISIENALLEPAFLCNLYGIQGRLDILEIDKTGVSKIVELKSGSAPWPDNGTGIKPNHSAQLFLYYQLIGVINNLSFKEVAEKTVGYILYSKVSKNNLRYDKPNLSRVQRILDLRNRIIINEYTLATDDLAKTQSLIQEITPKAIVNAGNVNPRFRSILENQIETFTEPILNANELEKTYFYSFVSFVAKEQYLAKLGDGPSESNHGLANLWLTSFHEKVDKFEILYDLQIIENKVDQEAKQIIFSRPSDVDNFVNFRNGDICVLYPREEETENATTNQVFKCSIKSITKEKVVVSFRYKQRNTSFFDKFDKWALERDFMDYSFSSMYKNLYVFLNSSKEKRALLLGNLDPRKGSDYEYNQSHLSEEQNRILHKALTAKDYFLLNGPPGTGKTSIIVKELVKELHKEKSCNILLLAYTNRAVDELCDAVNHAIDGGSNEGFPDERNFIRIGGQLSCASKHQNNLLNNVIEHEAEKLKENEERFTRDTIREVIDTNRVFVSTVSSISGKTDIFKLKKFDIIIIDEASQILEPQIIGLLTNCPKFILIGDHKQLPAIVLQEPESSKTNNPLLEEIGLFNRKNSLFERLYHFCEQRDFDFAFDRLTYQGRMHKEIALFPNYSFYNSTLKQAFDIPHLNPEAKEELRRQVDELSFESSEKGTLLDLLSKKRLIFFQSKTDKQNHFGKSNLQEAELVVKLVEGLQELYSQNNRSSDSAKTVGIIAPFKNQIALIKRELEKHNIPDFENITVDTVERFQGSQRDVIIFSFAINNPFQLNGMINLNDDGTVDRKLNVALTRAKEQLILIGNDSLLSNSLLHYKLIEFIKAKGGYIWESIDDVLQNKFNFNYFDSEESIEGKQYIPDSSFSSVFEQEVINVLKLDQRTINYPNLILGVSIDFIRNNIINYGRADFDQASIFDQSFTGEDKVNLYCFYNMRKHYFSGLSIFDTFKELFEIEIKQTSGRTTFIDFGCGPLTSGLAFNQALSAANESFSLSYIGIDTSNSMLNKAKEFAKSDLFHSNTSFQFINSFKQIDNEILEDHFRLPNIVLLNFSYIFANLSTELIYEIALDLNTMMRDYPLNKYLLVYQNPVHRHHNFTKFKSLIQGLDKSIVRKSETVSYKNDSQSWYDKSEKFTYEILSN